jgi:hypothetical protein
LVIVVRDRQRQSSQGDGISYTDFVGNRQQNPTDLAFALFTTTTTVPEPGSLMFGLCSWPMSHPILPFRFSSIDSEAAHCLTQQQ